MFVIIIVLVGAVFVALRPDERRITKTTNGIKAIAMNTCTHSQLEVGSKLEIVLLPSLLLSPVSVPEKRKRKIGI
jgi:hypothetical protein